MRVARRRPREPLALHRRRWRRLDDDRGGPRGVRRPQRIRRRLRGTPPRHARGRRRGLRRRRAAAVEAGEAVVTLWRWLWWSLVGRCLRCGARRSTIFATTRGNRCLATELAAELSRL